MIEIALPEDASKFDIAYAHYLVSMVAMFELGIPMREGSC